MEKLTIIKLLPLIIFFVTFAMVIYWSIYSVKKRRKEIQNWASSAGLEYIETGEVLELLKHLDATAITPVAASELKRNKKGLFDFFRAGSVDLSFIGIELFAYTESMKAQNLIIVPFKQSKLFFFDYSRVIIGKNSHTEHYGLGLYKSCNIFPNFYLHPQSHFNKILEFIGPPDINIPGYEDFSKKYSLSGKDAIQILSFFTSERIMALEQNPGWTVYAANYYIVLYKYTNLVAIRDYPIFIEEVKNLLNILKIE